jgi:hypothetical protein
MVNAKIEFFSGLWHFKGGHGQILPRKTANTRGHVHGYDAIRRLRSSYSPPSLAAPPRQGRGRGWSGHQRGMGGWGGGRGDEVRIMGCRASNGRRL